MSAIAEPLRGVFQVPAQRGGKGDLGAGDSFLRVSNNFQGGSVVHRQDLVQEKAQTCVGEPVKDKDSGADPLKSPPRF